MATYQVNANGNAPSNAKVGDQIVTQGGTYQVVDGSPYTNADGSVNVQLANANGVAYNPSSGLYSKKVSNISSGDVALTNTSLVDDWYNANVANQKAMIEKAYNTNVANAKRAYNNSMAQYNQQANNTKAEYLKNIENQRELAYNAQKEASSMANARGLTSSAAGMAYASNALANTSKNMKDIDNERANALDNIWSAVSALMQNHELTLNELEANKLADEMAAMSTADLKKVEAMLSISQSNNDAYNNALEAQKNRDWQTAENAKDRAQQMAIARLSAGGYGGGSGSSADMETADNIKEALLNLNYRLANGQITQEEYDSLYADLQRWENNDKYEDSYAKHYYTTLANHGIFTEAGSNRGYSKVKWDSKNGTWKTGGGRGTGSAPAKTNNSVDTNRYQGQGGDGLAYSSAPAWDDYWRNWYNNQF